MDIFWYILDKMKVNWGQECVKEGLLSFQGKIGTIATDFPEKMTVFSVLTILSTCLSLKSGISKLNELFSPVELASQGLNILD